MTILDRMLEQYRHKHQGEDPKQILVAPAACVALAAGRAVGTHCQDIPVRCRLFEESEIVPHGTTLGVFAKRLSNNEICIASCDLK